MESDAYIDAIWHLCKNELRMSEEDYASLPPDGKILVLE